MNTPSPMNAGDLAQRLNQRCDDLAGATTMSAAGIAFTVSLMRECAAHLSRPSAAQDAVPFMTPTCDVCGNEIHEGWCGICPRAAAQDAVQANAEPAGWQYRFNDPVEGWGLWNNCRKDEVRVFNRHPDRYETRELFTHPAAARSEPTGEK